MRQSRIDYLQALTKEEKEKLSFKDFTVSEIGEIIAETPLNELNKSIARMRFIECCTIDEIASKLYIDYKTCQRKIQLISGLLKKTIIKLVD